MPQYIEREVVDIREAPSSGEFVELILGFEEGHLDEVQSALIDLQIDEIEEGPFNTVKIVVEESMVDEVCNIDHIVDIELNSKGTILSAGN